MQNQLRILSITAQSEKPVQYELEQQTLLDSFKDFDRDKILIDMPDPVDSTINEIHNWLTEYKHHILIISCHGSEDGKLEFEDENGKEYKISGNELAENIKKLKYKPQIVILSSCHSANENKNEISLMPPARQLSKNAKIPCVIGMNKEISNFAAIDFNKGFFDGLVSGKTISEAFNEGCQKIEEGEENRKKEQGIHWVYFNEKEIPEILIDDNLKEQTINNFEYYTEIEKLFNPEGFNNALYAQRGFVGRRKELRLVLQSIFAEKQSIVILKGIGGIGKSSLTTRICSNLIRKDYKTISFFGNISVSQIINKLLELAVEYEIDGADYLYNEFKLKDQKESKNLDIINDNKLDWRNKLYWLIENLFKVIKVAVILDNFENNQIEETGEIKNQELIDFFTLWNKNISNTESVILLTTRYEIPTLRDFSLEIAEFSYLEIRKLFLNYNNLSRLNNVEIQKLHNDIGGNPRALKLLESLLLEEYKNTQFSYKEINLLLESVKSTLINGNDDKNIDFTPLFLNRLIGYLNNDEKHLLKGISIYRIPIDKTGLEIFGINNIKENITKLENLSLAIDMGKEGYYTHRLTSYFVTNPENNLFNQEELIVWHRKAGEYLYNIEDKDEKKHIDYYIEAIYQYKEAKEYDRAFGVANTIQNWLSDHGYVYEAREVLEEFIDKNIRLNSKNMGNLYFSIGVIEQKQGDLEKSLEFYNKGLKINEKIINKSDISKFYNQIGMICNDKGEYNKALDYHNQSLKIAEEFGNKIEIASSYHNIGIIYQNKGEYNQSIEFYNKSLEIFEELKIKSCINSNYHNIGSIYYIKGEYDKSLDYYDKSLKIAEELEDLYKISNSYGQFGMIYYNKGEYNHAMVFYNKSLIIKEKLGDKYGIGGCYHNIGMIYQNKKQYNQAIEFYNKSLKIAEEIHDKSGISKVYHQIGNIFFQKYEYNEAIEFYNKSLEIKEEIGDKSGIGKIYHQMGNIHYLKGEYKESFEFYNKSLKIIEKLEDLNGIGISYLQFGKLFIELKDYEKAFSYLIEAYLIFKKLESPNKKIVLHDLLKLKNYISNQQYLNKLEEYGINIEEINNYLNRIQENPLSLLTKFVYQKGKDSINYLNEITNSNKNNLIQTEDGKNILKYLDFLLQLAQSHNKEQFLANANKQMVEMFLEMVG